MIGLVVRKLCAVAASWQGDVKFLIHPQSFSTSFLPTQLPNLSDQPFQCSGNLFPFCSNAFSTLRHLQPQWLDLPLSLGLGVQNRGCCLRNQFVVLCTWPHSVGTHRYALVLRIKLPKTFFNYSITPQKKRTSSVVEIG